MKKGYYIYYQTGKEFTGVEKKIENQAQIFRKYYDFEKIVICKQKTNFLKSIIWRLPLGSYGRNYDEAFNRISSPDFIYVRFVPVDRKFLGFIKNLRKKYPTTKLILEVATYPYGRELLGKFSMMPFYFKDIFYHRWLKKYLNCVVTFSEDDYIFGVPTIRTKNGIIVDAINPVESQEKMDGSINLIAVGMFQKHHGYERVIKGLSEYYRNVGANSRKIYLHMVGSGVEKRHYENLTRKLNLEKYIKFWGEKSGKELDEIYNMADIAVSSLGLYKLKINLLSALKTREYLAKGLPIITGCKVDVLRSDFPYYLEYENNDSPIAMDRVIDFYDSIYISVDCRKKVVAEIRKFAKENVDMPIVLQPIIEYINS